MKIFIHKRRGVFFAIDTGKRIRWIPEKRTAEKISQGEIKAQWEILSNIEFYTAGFSLPRKGISAVNMCTYCFRIVDMIDMDTHITTGKKICRRCLIGSDIDEEIAALDVTQSIPIGGVSQSEDYCHGRFTMIDSNKK